VSETTGLNLVLYSGGDHRDNSTLSRQVASLLESKASPLVTFVPADGGDAQADFRAFKRKFSDSKNLRFQCIAVDKPLSREEARALFSGDAIFLGGGNTFYFLHHLRTRRLLPRLRAFARRGGLLMGLSAGSIILTPTINLAAVPALDADDNDIGLRRLGALGLVPFEFSPHYEPSAEVDSELRAYSSNLKHPVYAAEDGAGLVVKNGKIKIVGRVSKFHRGRKIRMQ
jgi:dipeptidase E